MFGPVGIIGTKNEDYSFGAIYNHSEQAPSFRFHFHPSFEFHLFINGHALICFEDILYEPKPYSLFIFPPNMLHGLLSLDEHCEYERMFFHFQSSFLSGIGREGFSLLQIVEDSVAASRLSYQLNEEKARQMYKLIQNIERRKADGNPLRYALDMYDLITAAVELVSELDRQSRDANGIYYQKHPFVSSVLTYISTNYREDISLDDIANNANVSKYYLSHEFKRLTNSTIMTYVKNMRLQYALNLLRNGKTSTEACFSSGFSCYSSFQKAFRSYFSCSPRSYKKISR